MAYAAERKWAWFRRWQGAVRVVDCHCRSLEIAQFLLIRSPRQWLGGGQHNFAFDITGTRLYAMCNWVKYSLPLRHKVPLFQE